MKGIEIPFGAKDSELCGWEYTIPEGMEAVVENGKVIVRRKESEDERMIEMIIDCLNRAVDVKYISLADRGKCLAYLERLKEEADRRLEMVEQHCKNVDELGEKIKSLQKKLYGKQKEQKPSEKQDYSGLNDLERAIHRGFLSAGVENVPVTIIKETAQDCLSQMKPAEWMAGQYEKIEGELVDWYSTSDGKDYCCGIKTNEAFEVPEGFYIKKK